MRPRRSDDSPTSSGFTSMSLSSRDVGHVVDSIWVLGSEQHVRWTVGDSGTTVNALPVRTRRSPWADEQGTDRARRNACEHESSEEIDIEITSCPLRHGQQIVPGHEQKKHERAEQAGAGAEKRSDIPPRPGDS